VERRSASTVYAIERTETEYDPLVLVDGARTEMVTGFDSASVGALQTLTVAGDGEVLAGLDADRRVVVVRRDEEPGTVAADDSGGVAPAFDTTGRLWFAVGAPDGGEGAGDTIASASGVGAVASVEAPWLADEDLLAVAPAPDAVRMLVISQEDTGVVRARLAAVERDPWGVPVALGAPILIATLAGPPVGVAWVDQVTVALLAPEAGTLTPQVLIAGGLTTQWRTPSGAGDLVGIAAGPTVSDLVIVTETGDVFARIGARWEPRATGVRVVAYPA
jgi:hypothetical protein